MRGILIKIRELFARKAVSWALKNPRRASFYYWFFNKSFDLEHYSVLCGRNLNQLGNQANTATEANLRRWLHMIEKGLTTKQPKKIFAESYICQAVQNLKVIQNDHLYKPTVIWAYMVLEQYFAVVIRSKAIDQAFVQYEAIKETAPAVYGVNSIKAGKHKSWVRTQISYQEFLRFCRQRRSIRWYQNKEVPLALIKNAVQAALAAPSACNRQPFRFIIVKESEKLTRTVSLPEGNDTFADNIKMMVLLIGDQSAYSEESDRHLIYIDGGLASMTFMLALETLGLTCCPVKWPESVDKEKSINKEFKLQPHEKGILFFSVGYPLKSDGLPISARKSPEQVVTVC